MGKATSKASGKQRAELVGRVVTAMDADSDEPTRLWQAASALGTPRDPDAAREALAASNNGGVTRSWLAVIAGAATADDIRAVADMAASSKSARLVLAEAMHLIADKLDSDVVIRVAENLDPAAPFAPFMLDHGRRAALTMGRTELAAVLQARHAFMHKHGETLADLRDGVQEKKQVAALAAVRELTGADKDHVLLYLIGDHSVSREAQQWTRVESVANPAVPTLLVAFALNSEYGIYDEEEKQYGERFAAAGQDGFERAASIIATAAERTMVHTLDHMAEGCPRAFDHPTAFSAILRNFSNDWVRKRVCDDARLWVRHLGATHAQQLAERIVEESEKADREEASLGRAFFYFMNEGGLATFKDALARDLKYHTRDELYDAVENIPGTAAQDVLIDMLWREKTNQRDLVYAFNKACMPHRHADVLARLDRDPSFEAAWIYGGCQTNWANRPRFLLDVIERVLAWPAAGTPEQRAYLWSCGVKAALELRRYPMARRLLDELGTAKTGHSPGDRDLVKTILADDNFKAPLAALESGELEAEQQKLFAEVDALRAAGTPRAADDSRLGMLAGGTVAVRLHEHAKTREVWFFDTEGVFHYYDGFGVTAAPFEFMVYPLIKAWDPTCEALARVTADWRTEARALHRSHATGVRREVLLCGTRILMRFCGNHSQYSTWRAFVIRCSDIVDAARMFDALASNTVAGFSTVDPFYVAGKKGGGWVRRFGENIRASCVGTTLRWGDDEIEHDSPEEARAAFQTREAERISRGDFLREIDLNEHLRPASDLPLEKFLKDRYRDDDKDAAWHLQALPAIRSALARSELVLDDVEVELGPPATAADLAAYDAALPEPMHPALRAMWQAHGHAAWRVGSSSMRLLPPSEVLARRQELRDELAVRVSTLRQQNLRDSWPVQFLDVLVTDGDTAAAVWDIRQQESDCFEKSQDLKHPWRSTLSWVLSESFNRDFVEALKVRFPEIKKLLVGQSVTELSAKGKAKPAAKPAAKAKPTKTTAAVKTKASAKAKPAVKTKAKAKPTAKPAKGKPAAKTKAKAAKKKR